MVGESLRRWGFWSLDFLKGQKVRRHYNDIKSILDTENYEKQRKPTNIYLENLMRHAVINTEYYSKFKGYRSIKDFPIIDKNIIRENRDKMISKTYKNKKIHHMSTSGSTGTPLEVFQDMNKRNRVLAELLVFNELAGYKIGDKNAYLRVWTEKNKKSKFELWKQNFLMIDVTNLKDENLERIRLVLKKEKVKYVLGYASSLDVLSRYLLYKNDTPDMFGVNVVVSCAETLSEIARNNLKRIFGCEVVSRYSNQENGILAQEQGGLEFFIINSASYYLEFLKVDSDEEAEIGELSRVVITDLFNFFTPIIRYDIGDIAVTGSDKEYGKVIKTIAGKKRDFFYNTSGELLSPAAISVNMWRFNRIKQFQLLQISKLDYIFRLNANKDIYGTNEIIDFLKPIIGENANIKVEYTNCIPHLESGKFQNVVCKYVKDI